MKTLRILFMNLVGTSFMVLISVPLFPQKPTINREDGAINVKVLAEGLVHPWGIEFLPDDRILLTERAGNLRFLDTASASGVSEPIKGTPEVFNVGQGGMFNVAIDKNFQTNNMVYLTYAEPGPDSTATTTLGRGKLEGNELKNFEVIFRMEPRVEGPNHFGGRINFTSDDKILLTLA